MHIKNQYEPLAADRHYIDKTEALEKGIAVFPSIYIEGAAASGKTTAVKMLLQKHPEVEAEIFRLDEEMADPTQFAEKLQRNPDSETEGKDPEDETRHWVVFENLSSRIPSEMINQIVRFLLYMPSNDRAILVGRDRPAEDFLELIWKREMKIITQDVFLFSEEEVVELTEAEGSTMSPVSLYKETGGWAGCVDLMLRMSVENNIQDVHELRGSYEIDTYIRRQILDSLPPEEAELMRRAAVCPWINEMLCQEIWNITYPAELLERLCRKGLLIRERNRRRWKIAPLFQKNYQAEGEQKGLWKYLGKWYEKQGCIKEALWCLKKAEDKEAYRSSVVRYYDRIPFSDISYKEIMEWKDDTPQICYLRGMYCYVEQNLEGLWREIRRLGKSEVRDKISKEIYLNLMYVNPEVPLTEWIAILEDLSKDGERFRLFGMLGGSPSYLCGFRDLSGLFACAKREENRMARIWKDCLGDPEWKAYQLARLDYYLETERIGKLREEDKKLLDRVTGEEKDGEAIPWRFRLAGFYLLCKIQAMEPEAELDERIRSLEQRLYSEEREICKGNAKAVSSLYALWHNETEKLSRWLLYSNYQKDADVREDNYFLICCQAKGYLLMDQYEKAERINREVIPYLQKGKRYRFLAEVLFQQAIICWKCDRHSQALQNIIESFLINGDARYVGFYVTYGKRGIEVLDEYIYWMRSNSPEGWHRKKKYNYGNVVRMPVEDYLEVIRRCMKRESKASEKRPDEIKEERLTMMEMVILQDIGRGLSNAEICVELNLKLPTVKSHIYSLYKKLEVNSRVQAILKGKEKGILE